MAQPDLIPMPFAENATPGTIEPIPATTPTVPQDATWSTGFPQVTMQPLASGGIPPRGQNFNGVLNALSQHIFHMQGGGQYKWDDAHGPYSIGDVLQSDDGLRSYVSVVDNNTDNFNTTPSAIGDTWHPWSGGASSELVAGLIQLATSAETQTGTNTTKAVTPSALSSRTSTESRTGLIQIATTAEAQALTDDTKALTPKKLLETPVVAKAWVKFGPTGTILSSFNVSSVTRNNTGYYTINFSTPFANGEYAALLTAKELNPLGNAGMIVGEHYNVAPTATQFALQVRGSSSHVAQDTTIHAVFFGDQE